MQIKAPKGTRDILPTEIHKWHSVEAAIRDICERFCYDEIRIPVFEHTELFMRGVGETTDIVQKEMYTFPDKSKRSLTLRPEGTAGVVRAFIENGLIAEAMPQKMYYVGPMYRYENVQKGRYREFRQFGCEVFGAPGPEADIELIALLLALFDKLGLLSTDLRINSIGCPKCRPGYMARLREFIAPKLPNLCYDCLERFERNPLRVIDCKNERCAAELSGAPMSLDNLCDECSEHFDGLKTGLSELGISYTVDKSIVRGLDYYTRTVFEFASGNFTTLGAAICGGGRYDGLIGSFGAQQTPGVGFAVGIERLLTELEMSGAGFPEPSGIDLFVITSGDRAKSYARKLVNKIRAAGYSADFDFNARSVKAQMRFANKRGARYTVVVGDNELDGRSGVIINRMADKYPTELGIDIGAFCDEFENLMRI